MKHIQPTLSALVLVLSLGCQEPRLAESYQAEPHPTEAPTEAPAEETAEVRSAAAAAATYEEPISDFNGNGIDDAIDITDMNSLDENFNGIPDEAEIN